MELKDYFVLVQSALKSVPVRCLQKVYITRLCIGLVITKTLLNYVEFQDGIELQLISFPFTFFFYKENILIFKVLCGIGSISKISHLNLYKP